MAKGHKAAGGSGLFKGRRYTRSTSPGKGRIITPRNYDIYRMGIFNPDPRQKHGGVPHFYAQIRDRSKYRADGTKR